MSKMEFLDPLEAEKFKKQKCVQFCRTPCSLENTMMKRVPVCLADCLKIDFSQDVQIQKQ